MSNKGFLDGSVSKESPCNAGDVGPIPWLHGNQSRILAWKILRTGEPGRLQSIGSQRVTTESTEHPHTHLSNKLSTWTARRQAVILKKF